MKPELPSPEDQPLRDLLKEWHVDNTMPPRFQEQVWHRIARRETLVANNPWSSFFRWAEGILARPSLAFTYLVFLVLIGSATGYWQRTGRIAQGMADARASYVQQVDPYQTPH